MERFNIWKKILKEHPKSKPPKITPKDPKDHEIADKFNKILEYLHSQYLRD